MAAGVKVQQSRFALLKVEDDEDSDLDNKKQKVLKSQQNGAAKKKKNKKKKGAAAEDAQLRSMAFGSGKALSRPPPARGVAATDEQWKQWQKLDKELTEDSYEKDLQQAILQSKLDLEEQKQVPPVGESHDDKKGQGKDKKKKKKEKNAMTLDEFNKLEIIDKPQESDEELIEIMPAKPKLNTAVTAPETEFFSKVDQEVSRSIRKEKIQEEYKKQYSMESAIVSKYKADLEEKDKEIQELKSENKKLKDDYKEVKKRNQQLCVILSQGEMKDKKAVLVEVEQLKSIGDELTAEVENLTSDLEKERSSVRSLKEELAKLKGNRQGGR